LRRISDIVSEIETQANSLRRQAAKTRRYKSLREEFRASLRQTFSAEGKFLSELVDDYKQNSKKRQRLSAEYFGKLQKKTKPFAKPRKMLARQKKICRSFAPGIRKTL
jgi:chromosome segregation ATPase